MNGHVSAIWVTNLLRGMYPIYNACEDGSPLPLHENFENFVPPHVLQHTLSGLSRITAHSKVAYTCWRSGCFLMSNKCTRIHLPSFVIEFDIFAIDSQLLDWWNYTSFRTESITKHALTKINTHWEVTKTVMAAKLTRLNSQNSDTTAPSSRELYHLQFSLQAARPEAFGNTLVHPVG
jgi:hypothetical protein